MFRPLPVWLSRRQLSLACPRQTKQAFPPVFSTSDANPPLLPDKAQRPCQCRTVHREAGTQPFLISLSSRCQCREQTELRDLQTCLSQLLVIDPRYDPREAAQVLTRTGQFKKRVCGLASKGFLFHIRCIYILCPRLSSGILPPSGLAATHVSNSRHLDTIPRPLLTPRLPGGLFS